MQEELIPLHTPSYDSLTFVHTKCACVYKKVGHTPLQVVRDVLPYLQKGEVEKCTYVGRLDPMAEGWMHILWNGDMEEKARLASSDKIYEIEVLCGVKTDTGDVLGLAVESVSRKFEDKEISKAVQSFVGPFTYPYPTYSSPNIKETLRGEVKEKRMQKGIVHKIDEVGVDKIDSIDLQKYIVHKIGLSNMDGDFRLEQILKKWESFFKTLGDETFLKIKLQVTCSSGTYMRTLAEELGKKLRVSACALSIKRIGIVELHTVK